MPLISIIMPVYNKAIYLNKSITSLINQTFTELELIIVNDGSTDDSFNICREFAEKDSRIKVINIENLGVSNARNIGLQNATGKYVQFIDSDDYVELDMLCKFNNIIKKYDPDIILCGITKVDKNYNKIKKILPTLQGLKSKSEMLQCFCNEQFTTGLYGCVSNKLIRRSIIKDRSLEFNKDIKLAEDLDFYLTLYNYIESIYFCNESYYYYLQNAENSSTSINFKNDYFTQILINLKAKNMLSKNNSLNINNENIINKVITSFTLCYLYEEFDYSFSKNKKVINRIYGDQRIVMSLTSDNQNLFKRIIILLIKSKSSFVLLILLYIRKRIEVIYRKIRYGVLKGKI